MVFTLMFNIVPVIVLIALEKTRQLKHFVTAICTLVLPTTQSYKDTRLTLNGYRCR